MCALCSFFAFANCKGDIDFGDNWMMSGGQNITDYVRTLQVSAVLQEFAVENGS